MTGIMMGTMGSCAAATINLVDAKVELNTTNITGTRDTLLGTVPRTGTAELQINTNGTALRRITEEPDENATITEQYNSTDWFNDKPQASIGDNYEVFVALNGSSPGTADVLSGDALSTWLAITSNRAWTLTDTGNNDDSTAVRTLGVSIRNATTLEVVAGETTITLRVVLSGP